MNSNKRKEDITCCPSLTKKLKVKNDFFCATVNPLEISTRSSTWSCDYDILPKVTLFSGIMFEKRESAVGQQQKACSMLIVSAKSFFQHGGFVKVQIKKPFGDQIRPATILFQDSITSKHAVSPQFLLVSYVAIPLSCFFFLKHYVETKEKTGRVLYRATAKMSKKCSLSMMPLCEI